MSLQNALGNIALDATVAQVRDKLPAAPATSTLQQVIADSLTAGIRGIRRDADTSPVADGQTHALNTNQNGRLKVSNTPGAYTITSGTITSATTVIGPVDVSRASNVIVELASGTFAGVNVTFETSQDGTTWKSELLLRSNGTGTQESATGVLAAVPTYRWEASVNGLSLFRIRATAWTSGAPLFNISLGADATEPFVTVAPHAVTLTSTAVTQSGTWNVIPQTPAQTNTGDTGAKTATFNGATQTNVAAKGCYLVFNIGTVSGTTPTLVAKVQGSADGGSTWFDIPGVSTATLTATGVYVLEIYPDLPAVAPTATPGTVGVIPQVLPRVWRVVYTIGGTTPSFALTNVQISYVL